MIALCRPFRVCRAGKLDRMQQLPESRSSFVPGIAVSATIDSLPRPAAVRSRAAAQRPAWARLRLGTYRARRGCRSRFTWHTTTWC